MPTPPVSDKKPDVEVIQKGLLDDNFVAQFAKEGAELLEQTNRPNVITAEEFSPFVELFNIDKERYGFNKDAHYTAEMNKLYQQFVHGLGINLYEVTYVVVSKEDQTVLGFLDRRWSRIAPDHVEGMSHRQSVPLNTGRSASTTRDDLIVEASVRDVAEANSTPEMAEHFFKLKMESAIIQRHFTELNQTADKRPTVTKGDGSSDPVEPASELPTTLIDDDDD